MRKLPVQIKFTFLANFLLFAIGLVIGSDIMMATSVIIFVILSAEITVLEAIERSES